MQIDQQVSAGLMFSDIKIGECFQTETAIYMRIKGRGDVAENDCGVRLHDGQVVKFAQRQLKVQPLKLKVVEA